MDITYRYFCYTSGKFVHYKTIQEAVKDMVENNVLTELYDLVRSNCFERAESIHALQVIVDATVVGEINISKLLNSLGYYIGDTCYNEHTFTVDARYQNRG